MLLGGLDTVWSHAAPRVPSPATGQVYPHWYHGDRYIDAFQSAGLHMLGMAFIGFPVFFLGFLILPKYWTGERPFAFGVHDLGTYLLWLALFVALTFALLWFGGPPLVRWMFATGRFG